MIRRILYSGIIIFLNDYPIGQAFTFSLVFCPILAYHLVMNPYLSTITNIMMDINEMSFIVIGAFFFIFAEKIQDSRKLDILGWTVIAIILAIIVANLIVLWIVKIFIIKKEFSEWWKAYKGTNSQPQNNKNSEHNEEEKMSENSSRMLGNQVTISQFQNPNQLDERLKSPKIDPSMFLGIKAQYQEVHGNKLFKRIQKSLN